jgi:hypothetical protein
VVPCPSDAARARRIFSLGLTYLLMGNNIP